MSKINGHVIRGSKPLTAIGLDSVLMTKDPSLRTILDMMGKKEFSYPTMRRGFVDSTKRERVELKPVAAMAFPLALETCQN